jgi:cell division septal protein FtsQ
MARAGFTLFALLAILIAVYHEFFIMTLIDSVGALTRKKVEMVGNTNCSKVKTLQACESVS